jgi:hypothetical protein
MPDEKPRGPVKFIAVILTLGGIAGVFTVFWSQWQVFEKTGFGSWKPALLMSVIAIVFAFTGWVGVELWTGRPRAYEWAKLALLLQIPQVSLAAFSYHFYTALAVYLSLQQGTESKLGFSFEVGSELSFLISSEVDDVVIGVNLIAVALLIYLIWAKRKPQVPTPLPPPDTDAP